MQCHSEIRHAFQFLIQWLDLSNAISVADEGYSRNPGDERHSRNTDAESGSNPNTIKDGVA